MAAWIGSYSTAAATSNPACSKPSARPPAPAKRSMQIGRLPLEFTSSSALRVRTVLSQNARLAHRFTRQANGAAVRNRVHVESVAKVRWHLSFDKVLRSIGAALCLESQPDCYAMGMHVDRQDLAVEGIHQDALCNLLPHPGQGREESLGIFVRHCLERRECGPSELAS